MNDTPQNGNSPGLQVLPISVCKFIRWGNQCLLNMATMSVRTEVDNGSPILIFSQPGETFRIPVLSDKAVAEHLESLKVDPASVTNLVIEILDNFVRSPGAITVDIRQSLLDLRLDLRNTSANKAESEEETPPKEAA